MTRQSLAIFAAAGLGLAATPAYAAEALDGAALSAVWALPFLMILGLIATGPVLYRHLWEHHFGKFAIATAALVIVPLLATNPSQGFAALAQTALHEYLPFILLLFALYVVAGGIYLEGNLHDSVFTNTVMLAAGGLLASVIGTTGAAMILIRPLIRANDDRKYNMHVVIFFIFIVANIGGSLTPLGDPPLFIGFLKGVDFFWTTTHLILPMLFVSGCVLAVFMPLDVYLHRRERGQIVRDPTPDSPLRLHGKINILLIGVIIAAILMSAAWKSGVTLTPLGVELKLEDVLRDAIFIAVALASLGLTRKKDRAANKFSWDPIVEVAILFAAIFVCIIPVMAMLQAGSKGAFAPVLALVTKPDGTANAAAYFWLAGGLSSFLDNAPTYLVFFQLAGGDAQTLMTSQAATLTAISAGAVFMGANTYIGNAPNFMVYAMARQARVKMPGFFGYMLWSGSILLPIFVLTTLVFFR